MVRTRSIASIAAVAALVIAGCTPAGSGPSASVPPDVDLQVVAKDYTFDTPTLAMTAGDPALIHFTNRDGELHDIAIYPNADTSTAMFDGENIPRGSTVYDVPAFEAGTYFFKCTLHPIMYGDVQVAP